MLKEFSSRRFWIGLLAIFVIYSAYYLLMAENKNAMVIPRMFRHLLKISIVFMVYFTGTYFLGKVPQKWLSQVWHLIHISLITLLILLWLWHFLIAPLPHNFNVLGYSIHEFLISPLLYLTTGLLGTLIRHEP